MEISFIDKEITAWGGLALLKKLMNKAGFKKLLNSFPLHLQGSKREHDQILQKRRNILIFKKTVAIIFVGALYKNYILFGD